VQGGRLTTIVITAVSLREKEINLTILLKGRSLSFSLAFFSPRVVLINAEFQESREISFLLHSLDLTQDSGRRITSINAEMRVTT